LTTNIRIHAAEGALDVAFEGDGAPRQIGADNLVDLDLAYAVTCHKCQGSSAPRVIVPLYRTRVMDPSWLYTAVTRAERQVVLVGDPEVVAEALRRPYAAEARTVGFRWPGGPR
jgi:exodeoxyribonuclease V alpha subunit